MSTDERFARARELYERAIEMPPEERDAFLASECGDDHALRSELDQLIQAGDDIGEFLTDAAVSWRGKRIGQYVVKDVIAEGGMGIVLRAHQEHPSRDVAIKLIRGNAFTANALRRFELEAEVLGGSTTRVLPRFSKPPQPTPAVVNSRTSRWNSSRDAHSSTTPARTT